MTTARDASALMPVTTATRREVVIDALRRALLTGELRPGQRVKEAPLADALGVSRPTVREAIYQLVHEGAFVQVPYKGITVAQPSADDILAVAEVRVALETLAALQLAKDPEGPGMVRLRRALQAHLDAIEQDDLVAADLTHLKLHRALWKGADNPMLMRIWPLIESQVRIAMTFDQATLRDPARDAELHRNLVAVIESGDPDAIAREVRCHIADSAAEVAKRMAAEATA